MEVKEEGSSDGNKPERKNSPYWTRLLSRCQFNAALLKAPLGNGESPTLVGQRLPKQAIAIMSMFYEHPAGETVCDLISVR